MSPTLRWMLMTALASVYLFINWESAASMVALWQSSAYEHCIVIPLISLGLVWRDRETTLNDSWSGSWIGMFVFATATLLLFASQVSLIQLLEHTFLIVAMIALLWAIAGYSTFKKNWYPLGFLFLAVPAGDTLIPVLQKITADLCTAGLSILGVPAFREGMMITLESGNFEVARACSGFRYLNAGLALGTLLAYLYLKSIRLRAIYIALTVVVFVVMNGIRAFLTILVAAYSEMEYMTGDDHIYFGYVLFAITIYLMFQLAARWNHWESKNA